MYAYAQECAYTFFRPLLFLYLYFDCFSAAALLREYSMHAALVLYLLRVSLKVLQFFVTHLGFIHIHTCTHMHTHEYVRAEAERHREMSIQKDIMETLAHTTE